MKLPYNESDSPCENGYNESADRKHYQEKLDELNAELAKRDDKINDFYNSTSWKITAPLRTTSKGVRWLWRNLCRVLKLRFRLGTGRLHFASLSDRRMAVIQGWFKGLQDQLPEKSSGAVHYFVLGMFRHGTNTVLAALRLCRAGMRPENLGLLWSLRDRVFQEIRRTRSPKQALHLLKQVSKARRTASAKTLFLFGDIEGAMAQVVSDLISHPDDAELRVLAIGCAIELVDFDCAERHMNLIKESVVPTSMKRQLPFFRYTLIKAKQAEGAQLAIRQFDDLFSNMGCRLVRVQPIAKDRIIDSLVSEGEAASHHEIEYRPLIRGPLVSVVMTAFNVEHLIKTSVMSILNQSYRNLEVIVVDDCSTDGTLEMLRSLENNHKCLQVITKNTNEGTYVSKNMGILRARGKYVAFQDSDDWSHPDRLGKSIAVLESRPDILALTAEWVRMTTEGDLIIQNKNLYSYRSFISLVLRREEVVARAGFFDSVRAEADGEYINRITLMFGDDRVVHFPWPLCVGRARSASLTANPKFGLIRGRGRAAREEYREAYRKWHRRISKEAAGYMPFPLSERPFEAPKVMLPDAGMKG